MVDHAGLATGAVVDGLDAVAGGVEDEGAVVVGPVGGPWAGWPVVLVAELDHRLPPVVDLAAAVGAEADMQTTRHRPLHGFLADREVVPLHEPAALERLRPVEELERAAVEAAAGLEVWQTDPDVVDHTSEATPHECIAPGVGSASSVRWPVLDLRPNCECCDRDLPPDSELARICTFECTFCADCAEGTLGGRCPNCGGNFTPRPIRPPDRLERYPASAERVTKAHAGCATVP